VNRCRWPYVWISALNSYEIQFFFWYNCRSMDPICRSPTHNSTDIIVPQRTVSKCPLTQNLSTPETEIRYGFRSFVLTNILLLLPHMSHDVLRTFTQRCHGSPVHSPPSSVHASAVVFFSEYFSGSAWFPTLVRTNLVRSAAKTHLWHTVLWQQIFVLAPCHRTEFGHGIFPHLYTDHALTSYKYKY
jgi:hypothetical protein